MGKFIISLDKKKVNTKYKTFKIRTAYIRHIEELSVNTGLSINNIILQCLKFSINDKDFKPINSLKYDESKYLKENDKGSIHKSIVTTEEFISLIEEKSKSFNVAPNKLINEAIKYALVNL